LPAASGLRLARFDYAPINDTWAVVRLLAGLGAELVPARGAKLVLRHGAGRDADPARVFGLIETATRQATFGRKARRSQGTAGVEWLWRVSFAIPLELVEVPSAVSGLSAMDRLALALPNRSSWPAGLSAGGLDEAHLPGRRARRKLVALAATFAVYGVAPGAAGAVDVATGATGTGASGGDSSPPVHVPCVPDVPRSAQRGCIVVEPTATGRGTPVATVKPVAPPLAARPSTGGSSTSARHVTEVVKPKKLKLKARVLSTHGVGSHTRVPPPARPSTPESRGTRPSIVSLTPASSKPSPPRPTEGATGEAQVKQAIGTAISRRARGHVSPTAGARRGVPTKAAAKHATSETQRAARAVSTAGPAHFSSAVPGAYSAGALRLSHFSGLFANVEGPPPFLIPIFKAAGRRYGVPWRVLAAINSIETNYGRDLSVSSAGAIGWMQFMPGTWRQYGVDADGHSQPNPYDPQDAIFSAASYLKASGAAHDLRGAIFAYNHATWYVDEVIWKSLTITDRAITTRHEHGYSLPLDAQYMGQIGRTDDGVDLELAPDGAPVYSMTPGIVTAVASNPGGFGPNYPVVQVSKGPLAGQSIYYGHVAASLVTVGQSVLAGQPIAVMGHTGDADSLGHGHIEIGFSDSSGNPLDHHGATAWTPYGDVMRKFLVSLSAAFGIKNS
jgi:murein DD-endopeptidase MepM/ murein hydrolase activator NlpD